MRVHITARVVREAKFPDELRPKNSVKHHAIFDDEVKGFHLRITRGGQKAFWVKYSFHSKQRVKFLGDALADPDTIQQARKEANRIKMEARVGRDAVAEEKARRPIGDWLPEYLAELEAHVRNGYLRESSYGEAVRYLKGGKKTPSPWQPFYSRLPTDIQRHEVVAALDRIARTHRTTADRAKSAFNLFWLWMADRVPGLNAGLLSRVRRYSHTKRDRVLSAEELRTIWNALEDDAFGRCMKLLMLTGQREAEIGDLQRGEVNVGLRRLELPGSRTKNHRDHVVPLSEPAWHIVQEALAYTSDDRPFLFGRYGTAGFGAWSAFKTRLDRHMTIRLPHWTIHDIRRTVRTHMAEQRIGDSDLRARIQNHTRKGVDGVYDRSERLEERKVALDRWAAWLLGVVNDMKAAA